MEDMLNKIEKLSLQNGATEMATRIARKLDNPADGLTALKLLEDYINELKNT